MSDSCTGLVAPRSSDAVPLRGQQILLYVGCKWRNPSLPPAPSCPRLLATATAGSSSCSARSSRGASHSQPFGQRISCPLHLARSRPRATGLTEPQARQNGAHVKGWSKLHVVFWPRPAPSTNLCYILPARHEMRHLTSFCTLFCTLR
jgi:hypothetical protein